MSTEDAVVEEAVEKVVTPPVTDEEKSDDSVVADTPPTEESEEQPRDDKGKFAKKESRIPVDRHKAVLDKEREAREAAERRAAELEAKLKKEERSEQVAKMEQELEALEKQHTKLMMDGKHEDAAAVMKQIRHGERSLAKFESEQATSKATAQAVEQVRFDTAVARLESTYAQLNPESAEFDGELVDDVLAKQEWLIRKNGLSPSKALLTAAESIMNKYYKAQGEDAEDSDARKGLAAGARAADRKAEQVRKNLDTASKQPASMKDAGMDSDKKGAGAAPNIATMSADEWAALPEATKAKLRGDRL